MGVEAEGIEVVFAVGRDLVVFCEVGGGGLGVEHVGPAPLGEC